MTVADVAAVVDVQEPGAVLGLADVFPQDRYPFPREDLAERWRQEIATPGIDCLVVQLDGVLIGFAAIRDDEFFHFGIAVEHWGTGIGRIAHDAVVARMRAGGVRRAWLRVFTGNGRARRFYERLGWRSTGDRTNSSFPPYPELLHYQRDLG
ncbi:GNAT family N-acetyltransferase [Kribbella sp. VKM Ac-2566]|uniref:GNAT family N-acetyltransferase n=1 Tax=Kribbella sp. VKM Ac-2566 TaxID=2512218 RepID=UPI0010643BAD|nr:GNAT family N-acetyltransferase [Kribbella sp. VKM Ac-2566]